MPEEYVVDLIQRDLDRETSPDEKGELRERLERDLEARLYYEEMRGVTALLESTPPSEPPAHLANAIMSGVRGEIAGRAAKRSRIAPFRWRRGRLLPATVGIGLAAAALIAFLFAPSLSRVLDSSHLRGVMVAPARSGSLPAGQATIEVSATSQRVSLRFAPAASWRSRTEIEFDTEVLRLRSIEGMSGSVVAAGRVRIAPGAHPGVVLFDRLSSHASALSVIVDENGKPVHARTIEIPAATNF